jgi:sugar/nucleoside kinase (ribokinase family)
MIDSIILQEKVSGFLYFCRMKILGLGNALVDILVTLPDDTFLTENALPKGSMQLIDYPRAEHLLSLTGALPRGFASGGSAANTIHGLARLGVETAYIGKIGDDEHGIFFHDDMVKSGIAPRLLRSKSATGTAITLITPDTERTFGTYLGAAVELLPSDISPADFRGFDLLHIEGYLAFNQDLTSYIVKYAKEAGLKVSIDLASYNVVEANLDFLKGLVHDGVDILFANEEEAKAFTGLPPAPALEALAKMCDIAVVKVGKEGSLISDGLNQWSVPATEVTPVDTTGAGDLYASGFLYGLTVNKPLQTCATYGSIVAGKVIMGLGAKIPESEWRGIQNMIELVQ